MKNVYAKRAAAAVLAGMMLGAAQPLAADAADAPKKVVVIGDAISSGKGLADKSASYVSLVTGNDGYTVTDLASDSCTTEDLIASLDTAEFKTALQSADIVFLSVGMQDIMNPFMEQLLIYKERMGFETMDDLYLAARGDIDISDDELVSYSNVLADKIYQNEDSCKANLAVVGEKLSAAVSKDAKVYCINVYNPLDTIQGLQEKSVKRRMAYNGIMKPCGTVLEDSVTPAYEAMHTKYGFTVIDACYQFQGLAYYYTGLTDLNMNPTAAGHRWIAQQLLCGWNGVKLGDINRDGAVNASDAATLLEHAAAAGADGASLVPAEDWYIADANSDGVFDASDAAGILVYAAAVGAGDRGKLN